MWFRFRQKETDALRLGALSYMAVSIRAADWPASSWSPHHGPHWPGHSRRAHGPSCSVPQLSTRIPRHGDTPSMYCEAKLGARTYQAVKQQLCRAFQKAGLGTWVRKPPEQDQFLLAL